MLNGRVGEECWEQRWANAGSWSLEENLRYALFIDLNKKSMTSKKKMREMQFYDKLAGFVSSRTVSQCRSHHQKMFDKFKYVSKIIELFKNQIGITAYKARLLEATEVLKNLPNTQTLPAEENPPPLAAPAVESNPAFVTLGYYPYPYFMQGFYLFPGESLCGAQGEGV